MACHVLVYARMTRAFAVALFVAATSSVASAGTYVSLGIGNTGVDDSAPQQPIVENGRSYRLGVGYSFTPNIAVEGGLIGYGAARGNADYSGKELFIAAKGSYPISDGFSAFGKLGAQRTMLNTDTNQQDLSGTGYLFGAGFEYNLAAALGPASALARASVFVDYTRSSASVKSDAATSKARDLASDQWTLGVTVGF